jgi:2-succinyl-6-hydroxy-2,4-cyclohexadiene-1-carboxylate synthase
VTAPATPPHPHFVLAHGFTQTGRSWVEVERLLAERIPGCRTTSVDLPGHGDASSDTGDLWHAADHLVARGGPGTYVGYSMGGRVALHAALAHPDEIDALVLIGTTAGIDDPAERVARRAADERLAARIEQIGVAAFVREWLRNPLFAGLTDATAQTEDRCRNTPDGLASSLRGTGTGTQEPLWGRLDEITAPTLVLAGEHDDKFTRLGERLAASITDATFQTIPDAGHSVHLEQPAATIEAVSRWHVALASG